MVDCAGRDRDCAGRDRDCGYNNERRMAWEPYVQALQKDIKSLSQKVEVALETNNGGNEIEIFNTIKKTKEIIQVEANQISEMQRRIGRLEAAAAETANQLPLFATIAQLAGTGTKRTVVTHTYRENTYNSVSTEGSRGRGDLPEGYAERQESIDLRLSALEQRCSNFAHRLSTAEELTAQRPQLEHSTKADDLTTTLGNLQSAKQGLNDEPVPYSESSLTAQVARLSERLRLLEQSVNGSQGLALDLDRKEPPAGHETASNFPDASEVAITSGKMEDIRTSAADAVIKQMEYKWKPSIWDVAVFVFSEQMNFGESVVVVACLVFTLTLLLAFSHEVDYLIADKYKRFDETSQQEYHFWRTSVAHDSNFRNKFTDVSLASVICNGKLYASVSSLQLQTVGDSQDYLTERGLFSLPAGPWMAALSVCVWYLALVQEFRAVVDLLGASLQLKTGLRTTFEQDNDSAHTFHIVEVASLRKSLIGIIIVLKLGVVFVLGWQGTLFLLAEIDLENMILNSAALQMMLSFDDLLYNTVPPVPQAIVARMQPLKIAATRCPKCWHEWGLFIVLLCFGVTAFTMSIIFYQLPFLEDVRNSYDALCGGVEGSYDFVVAYDAIGIPWAAATTPISENLQEAYAQRAIATAKNLGFESRPLQSSQRLNLGSFMQVSSGQRLDHAVLNLPEFTDPTDWSMIDPGTSVNVVGWTNEFLEVLSQQDFADEPDTVYNHYLQHLLKRTGNVSCAQVPVGWCTKPGRKKEDVMMRKLCPTHCGCDSPTEGTVANSYGSSSKSNFTGCPVWNTRKKTFVDRLQDLPCADTLSRNDFVSWSRGVGDAVHSSGSMLVDHLVSIFDSGKCPDVAKIEFGGFLNGICQETSLPSICPESCGCNISQEWTSAHTTRYDFCPYSCHSSQPPCLTVAVTDAQDIPDDPRGPHAGFPCVFPFKEQGVTYHSCTSNYWTRPWCALTLVDGAPHFWGACPNTSACVN